MKVTTTLTHITARAVIIYMGLTSNYKNVLGIADETGSAVHTLHPSQRAALIQAVKHNQPDTLIQATLTVIQWDETIPLSDNIQSYLELMCKVEG